MHEEFCLGWWILEKYSLAIAETIMTEILIDSDVTFPGEGKDSAFRLILSYAYGLFYIKEVCCQFFYVFKTPRIIYQRPVTNKFLILFQYGVEFFLYDVYREMNNFLYRSDWISENIREIFFPLLKSFYFAGSFYIWSWVDHLSGHFVYCLLCDSWYFFFFLTEFLILSI